METCGTYKLIFELKQLAHVAKQIEKIAHAAKQIEKSLFAWLQAQRASREVTTSKSTHGFKWGQTVLAVFGKGWYGGMGCTAIFITTASGKR